MRMKPESLARITLACVWALLIFNASFIAGQILISRKVGPGNNPPPTPQIAALRTQYAQINLWCAVFSSMPIFVLLIDAAFGRKRHPPGHCPHCGYNLTGNTSGLCPECGTTLASAPCCGPAAAIADATDQRTTDPTTDHGQLATDKSPTDH